MPGAPSSPLVPVIFLLVVLATDVWVYADARSHRERGTPVFFKFGTFLIDTPVAWFFGCVFLWIVFFPLYVMARGG